MCDTVTASKPRGNHTLRIATHDRLSDSPDPRSGRCLPLPGTEAESDTVTAGVTRWCAVTPPFAADSERSAVVLRRLGSRPTSEAG
jgi:hypothetical protein